MRAGVVLAVLFAGACAPPSAIEIAPGAMPRLADVDSVFLDSALRTDGEGAGRANDLRAEVEELARAALPPIAAERAGADAILVFELGDRLDCAGCLQADDYWQWWGFVFDLEGREMASLHGELPKGHVSPAAPFVRGVRGVLKRSRKAR